jgi:hypothetical protein
MASKVTCSSCGWSWNKSDSSKKDLYICHQCGKDNTMKDGGWLNKFEDAPEAQNGIEGTMGGLTDKGFNYNGAWGGTMAMGGSLPGAVGFTYARTQSPAPSNGPYAKKTKASAQFGEKVKPNDKRSQKFYNQLEQYYTRPDATQVEKATYKAFQQLNEQYGYAPVGIKNKTIAGKRSMINPLTGRLNLVVPENEPVGEIKPEAKRMMEEYMNEYGHYQQYNEHPEYSKVRKAGNFLGDIAGDFGKMLQNVKGLRFKQAYNENYNTPGTTENEAHNIIQPKLQQELDENMLKNLTDASKSRIPQLQNGQEMKYYQEGLDWKPKSISKDGGWLNKYEDGGVIEDDMGQWAHPGEITKINSNQITMQGVDYPVLGISDTGDTKMMKPGKDYKFKGKSVTELPMMQEGGEVIKVKQPDGSFKTYNTDSEEYRKLYDSGNLMNYDKSTDTYFAKPLDEVVITGQAPEKGFWEQYRDDLTRKHNSGILDAVLGTPIDAVFGLPQRAMMYGLTGKVQDPSEALGIENPYGALAVNVLGDPLNAFGLGLTDDALRLTGKANQLLSEGRISQGLREVGQYLPARGEVISELKDLKRAAFPTKPTFINPSEQELLSTVRNVGLLSKTGAKDADILEKVLAKSSRLTDDEFKNLVGSTRSELKGKIQTLRETPKGAKKVGENQFEWDVNQSQPSTVLDANGNPVSTGNFNLNRPATSQAARDAASTRRQGRQLQNLYDQLVTQQGGRDLSSRQMSSLQTFVDDTNQLIRTDPDNAPNFLDFINHPQYQDLYNFKLEPNKSFIRGLTNRINEGRYLPQSYEQADAVLPNLYRDETNNPIAEMFRAMRIVERSPKGSTLKSAGSLSTDSYPATLSLSERLRDKGIVDINYTGMDNLNPSGFSQQAGIPTDINLKEMNTLIDQLNKKLPKPIPYGYIEGNYMKVPQISVTRKKNGGWLNKYE